MAWPAGSGGSPFSLHGIFALLFFLCIAYVCIFRASDTLPLIDNLQKRKAYALTYKLLGVFMVAFPVAAFVFLSLLEWNKSVIFFVEAAGVYAFSSYWVVKSREISQTNADHKAARGELKVRNHGVVHAFRPLPVEKK
jgi:glucan phosphoethanolaminetransferase (alkaline phosphatase superfamily)